uniref:Uncharacterized protein n=1 Tax=Manihot esculenta TaxID=3983 RepID=A0A2C9VBQ1_MANES
MWRFLGLSSNDVFVFLLILSPSEDSQLNLAFSSDMFRWVSFLFLSFFMCVHIHTAFFV